MSVSSTLTTAERSIRSVFVGNIPYEATEEQLKDIFSEVGPVVSFRLVYDRETGKPKGYGFCEYKDQETALSAMRNLNGYELNGRSLRVDNAASEKNKEELKSLQAALGGPPAESPYGTEVEPDKAPEAISRAVASLPPEQMFELMKQMKLCIQNNPNEARNMLLQNPQLAYALLQAQVVMRIVDPQVAMTMLHRPNSGMTQQQQPFAVNSSMDSDQGPPPPPGPPNMGPPSLMSNMAPPSSNMVPVSSPMPNNQAIQPPTMPSQGSQFSDPNFGSMGPRMGGQGPMQQQQQQQQAQIQGGQNQNIRPALLGDRPPSMNEPMHGPPRPPAMGNQFNQPMPGAPRDFDMRDPRGMDHRNMESRPMDPRSMGDRDMRIMPGPGGPSPQRDPREPPRDPREMPREGPRDPRLLPASEPESRMGFDPRFRGGPGGGPDARGGGGSGFEPRGAGQFEGGFDQRGAPGFESERSPMFEQRDPRQQSSQVGGQIRPPLPGLGRGSSTAITGGVIPGANPPRPTAPGAPVPISAQDQEKAALIMQVLQLSDQQISMLPPEQRQSIMVLKDQIARSTQPT